MPRRGSYGSGRSYGDYYGDYFPTSQPRAVKGGIKAQSQRGGFGVNWWAKRWLAVLEGFQIGARLSRGRSYARTGQVLDIAIEKGIITASVQGSRPQPYDVRIQVQMLARGAWEKVVQVIAGQAIFAASLLNGEMPQDIEDAFASAQASLFPEKVGDLQTSCSCPDWSNPCKHIAAVYYLIGEEFDRDPFLLFKMRGLSREDLLDRLRAPVASAGQTTGEEDPEASGRSEAAAEPLSNSSATFWAGQTLTVDMLGELRTPPVAAALPRRLGRFPFWRGEQPLLDALEPMYRAASASGLALCTGDYKVLSDTFA
jgi:uncharacterized Zn finger protein